MELNEVLDTCKNVYVATLANELNHRGHSKNKIPCTYVKCAKCGSTNMLHKMEDGTYLCDKCFKELNK